MREYQWVEKKVDSKAETWAHYSDEPSAGSWAESSALPKAEQTAVM